jgi:SAM-dependent methyltransferase
MQPSIVNLRQFYSLRLGRKVRRRLRRVVRDYWPHESGLHIVGVGYTTDLLPLPGAPEQLDSRILALMPVEQGAIYWPVNDANHSVLGDAMTPPFTTSSLHRVLMVHVFEHCAVPHDLLRVWWQLLVPGGRLMVIVPNRRGLWARFGATPFISGTPYSLPELRQLFNDAGFTLRDTRSALFAPPSSHPFWLRVFSAVEWLGAACFPRSGGALIVEAEKQIYAGLRQPTLSMMPAKQWKAATSSAMQTPRE